jgi:hypothetical protein
VSQTDFTAADEIATISAAMAAGTDTTVRELTGRLEDRLAAKARVDDLEEHVVHAAAWAAAGAVHAQIIETVQAYYAPPLLVVPMYAAASAVAGGAAGAGAAGAGAAGAAAGAAGAAAGAAGAAAAPAVRPRHRLLGSPKKKRRHNNNWHQLVKQDVHHSMDSTSCKKCKQKTCRFRNTTNVDGFTVEESSHPMHKKP